MTELPAVARPKAVGPSVVLRVQSLAFGFPGCPIVKGWSQDFPAGLSLILGGDGAGKTTVLRLLAGELAPGSGVLQMAPVFTAAPCEPQVFWRDPRSPWTPQPTPQAWADDQAAHYPSWSAGQWQQHATGFGLSPHLCKPMHQLSTGTQRKVLLAGALASGAPLTLIDEPTAALDRTAIDYLCRALEQGAAAWQQQQRAVVMAHYEPLGNLPWVCTVTLPQ